MRKGPSSSSPGSFERNDEFGAPVAFASNVLAFKAGTAYVSVSATSAGLSSSPNRSRYPRSQRAIVQASTSSRRASSL